MRGDLRLTDLGPRRTESKLMNTKVPENVLQAIGAAAAELGCSKTDVIVALFNEGLDVFEAKRAEFETIGAPRVRRGRPPVARAE